MPHEPLYDHSIGKEPARWPLGTPEPAGQGVMLGTPCAYSTGGDLLQQWIGTNLNNPQAMGSVLVDLNFTFHADYKLKVSLGIPAYAFSGTTFDASSGSSSASESLSVNGAGTTDLSSGLAGLSLTDGSSGTQIDKTFSGNFKLRLSLNYGPGQSNFVHTDAFGSIGINPIMSGQIAAVISQDASHTLSYNVVSLDPNVVFTAVPEPATGLLTGAGLVVIVVRGRRQRV